MSDGKANWISVTDLMDKKGDVVFNAHCSSWFTGTWHRALSYSSYYKFAAKMIGKEKQVLDVGCGDGFGTWILAKECGFVKGIDQDRQAIAVAQKNWHDKKIEFECSRLSELPPKAWNALVSFDARGGLSAKNAGAFFTATKQNLAYDGIVIFGIPDFLNEQGKRGKSERLEREMRRHFWHVFIFSASDEVIHAGYLRTADYVIAVGCRKK